jgi:hypothetical protein
MSPVGVNVTITGDGCRIRRSDIYVLADSKIGLMQLPGIANAAVVRSLKTLSFSRMVTSLHVARYMRTPARSPNPDALVAAEQKL